MLDGSSTKANTTFSIDQKVNGQGFNIKLDAKYLNKYPMSHLLETGLLVLNVEGIWFTVHKRGSYKLNT